MTTFALHERLEQDSVRIGKLRICQVRLSNDARWPWLVLVPEIPGAEELHDLSVSQQEAIALDTNNCGKALKQVTNCESINSAALGNVVRQLHIHVVARSAGDSFWPGPIWGFGTPKEYEKQKRSDLIVALKAKLF